jgi:hypothetical protein
MPSPGLTLITPTGARRKQFALLESYIRRQTYSGPLQWIVVDDAEPATQVTMGQDYLRPEKLWQPGRNTQARNIRMALQEVVYDKILMIEDDDWYGPAYLTQMDVWLGGSDELVGEIPARYYNVATRNYRVFANTAHASLCQTGFRKSLIPLVDEICAQGEWIDAALFRLAPTRRLIREANVVGIKGMPGRAGQVAGHARGFGKVWSGDPELETLRRWIGRDADNYAEYYLGGTEAVRRLSPAGKDEDIKADYADTRFHVFHWRGQRRFSCAQCEFDTHDRAVFNKHYAESHIAHTEAVPQTYTLYGKAAGGQ